MIELENPIVYIWILWKSNCVQSFTAHLLTCTKYFNKNPIVYKYKIVLQVQT